MMPPHQDPDSIQEALKQLHDGGPALDWLKVLVIVMVMQIFGIMGRALMSQEDLDKKRLTGELLLGAVAVMTLFAFGMLQGMEDWKIVVLGGLAGMGGARFAEWMTCIARHVAKNFRP